MSNGPEKSIKPLDGAIPKGNQVDGLGLEDPISVASPFARLGEVQYFFEFFQEVLWLVAERHDCGSRFGKGKSKANRIHGVVTHPVPLDEGNGFSGEGVCIWLRFIQHKARRHGEVIRNVILAGLGSCCFRLHRD